MSEKIYKLLFALMLFFLGIVAVGLALGWTTPLSYLQNILQGNNERWVLGILGVFSFLVSLVIMRNSLRGKIPTQTEVITTPLGKIKITVAALENMAVKVAKQTTGVKEAKPVIKTTPNGIAIFMQVFLLPDIQIPDTTTQIQNNIKEYFDRIAGIQVEEIRILVTKLSSETKSRVE